MTEEVMNRTPLCLQRWVGNTNYKVNICFSEQATRTMEDAILRLVKNEALHIDDAGSRSKLFYRLLTHAFQPSASSFSELHEQSQKARGCMWTDSNAIFWTIENVSGCFSFNFWLQNLQFVFA